MVLIFLFVQYFVTFVAPCPVVYTKIGCLRDDMIWPRPLPELLFTDRDPSMKRCSNIPLNWENWNPYMKDLVCRCAKEAKLRNYPYFSIQYYGKSSDCIRRATNALYYLNTRCPCVIYHLAIFVLFVCSGRIELKLFSQVGN